MTIYIAGSIKDDPNYRTKFSAAESYLIMKGWTVLNPACLPEDLKPTAYMPICLAMVSAADALVVLAGSESSEGAAVEQKFARYQGIPVYHGLEAVPMPKEV